MECTTLVQSSVSWAALEEMEAIVSQLDIAAVPRPFSRAQ